MIFLLLGAMGLPQAAVAQDTAMVRFKWAQPMLTASGDSLRDGWLVRYDVYVVAHGDTVLETTTPAPYALADSAWAYVRLEIGLPSAVQVNAVNKWGVAGPVRSPLSDIHVVIPDPPAAAGKPFAIK